MKNASPLPEDSPWARVPLLLHPGFHKTGTTWLQRKVFGEESGLPFHVIATPNETIRQILMPADHDFDPKRIQDAWEDELLVAEEKGAIAVITCERLADFPYKNRFSRPIIAQRLAAAFPHATVLWTIREQESVILSMYGQTVRFGESFSLEEFLYQPPRESGFRGILNLDYYDYDRVLDLYEGLFSRVLMVPYEAMIREPQAFTDNIFQSFGRAPVPFEVDSEKRVNAALAPPARWLARQLNRFSTPELRGSPSHKNFFRPNAVAQKVNRYTPQSIKDKGKLADKALVCEAVGDRYRASNARLQAKLGIDLSPYGYRVPD